MVRAAVARAEAAPSIAQGLAHLRPFLADIDWLETLLDDQCAAMARDPLHLPPMRTSGTGATRHLVLARTERVRIAITIVDAGPADPLSRLHFSGQHSLCRPLGRMPLTVDAFTLDAGMAVASGRHIYPAGAIVDRDEARVAWRIVAQDAPALFLRAQIAPHGPVPARSHDAASGALLSATSVDEGHARTLMMLSLLRMQGRTDAADRFAAAMDSPVGHQRWAVMREWLALDTRSALPVLDTLARSDPDVDLRRIATQTLDKVRARNEVLSCPA